MCHPSTEHAQRYKKLSSDAIRALFGLAKSANPNKPEDCLDERAVAESNAPNSEQTRLRLARAG